MEIGVTVDVDSLVTPTRRIDNAGVKRTEKTNVHRCDLEGDGHGTDDGGETSSNCGESEPRAKRVIVRRGSLVMACYNVCSILSALPRSGHVVS